jgi:hypothetical protein
MQKLVSIALCSLAAAAFALPAVAADEGTAKARAGANASVEGGTSLGGTGVSSGANAGVNAAGSGTVKQETTGDAQARRDNNEDESKVKAAKPAKRAKRKAERDAASGTTAPSLSY